MVSADTPPTAPQQSGFPEVRLSKEPFGTASSDAMAGTLPNIARSTKIVDAAATFLLRVLIRVLSRATAIQAW
jgi:hypothetical protein